ncbi:MAG: hypothetical protein Crog4KO_00880 [Crocinitomicaceae bacterium]
METFASILLIIHIAAGITCLLTGIAAIIVKKGGTLHRYSGKTYFFAMFTVIVTALILALFRDNLFLLLIASFSFYMTWAGVRSTQNRSLKATILDWIFLFIAAITAFVMIYTLNIVLLIFGTLFSVNIIQELVLFIRARKTDYSKTPKWLVRHIGMMLGSFIATCTAFLVTNVQDFQPGWLPWIAPTIIGTPLIAYYTRKTLKGN